MKGLHAYILRDSGPDCSAGGISSRVSTVTIVGDGIPKIFSPTPDSPAVELVVWAPCSTEIVHARPVDIPKGVHSMMGGCFIWSCDSRFPLHPGGVRAPIPLHDRVER